MQPGYPLSGARDETFGYFLLSYAIVIHRGKVARDAVVTCSPATKTRPRGHDAFGLEGRPKPSERGLRVE